MNLLISWNMINALWILFLVYWALGALRVKQTERRETSTWRLATLALVVAGASLIFSRSPYLGALHLGSLRDRFVPDREWIHALAVVLVAMGIGIAIWARRHLGEYWSARVTLKVDHQLIQSGPYRFVRHPIYSGVLLGMIGSALYVGEWRALVGVLLLYLSFWQKAWREERLLETQFGADYQHYRARTGRLLPRLR